ARSQPAARLQCAAGAQPAAAGNRRRDGREADGGGRRGKSAVAATYHADGLDRPASWQCGQPPVGRLRVRKEDDPLAGRTRQEAQDLGGADAEEGRAGAARVSLKAPGDRRGTSVPDAERPVHAGLAPSCGGLVAAGVPVRRAATAERGPVAYVPAQVRHGTEVLSVEGRGRGRRVEGRGDAAHVLPDGRRGDDPGGHRQPEAGAAAGDGPGVGGWQVPPGVPTTVPPEVPFGSSYSVSYRVSYGICLRHVWRHVRRHV